jgi:predicted dehydrogenase
MKLPLLFAPLALSATALAADTPAPTVRLVTLDPGHFHAALVQKTMYPQVDTTVHVYAPASDDLTEHLKRISGYNARSENPTHWQEVVYSAPDFFSRMLRDKAGNVVVIAGNNLRKTEYISASIDAGFNVLADKPMAIDTANFQRLEQAFAAAHQKGVLLYDIMTERSEITTVLQKEFSLLPELFGQLEKGTVQNPAVTKESVHYFYKFVSGAPLKRPAWAFDVTQQGEGIVDVTTHLVDLVQWECFPDQALDYHKDIQVLSAKRWPTQIAASEFNTVTGLTEFPDYLKSNVKDGALSVFANGELNYEIKGVHAKVSVRWNYRAPEGAGDMHYSMMRGTKCSLVIRQGADEGYKPKLYIEPAPGTDVAAFGHTLEAALAKVEVKYPGITLKPLGGKWQVIVPTRYDIGHEAHFGQVMERFLKYLAAGKLPSWEEPNMIAKYYTITAALDLAKRNQ